jgi:dihydroxy-acid dehydratase
VDEAELARRRTEFAPPPARLVTGYRRLFDEHVLGADRGCDFDFCVPSGPELR